MSGTAGCPGRACSQPAIRLARDGFAITPRAAPDAGATRETGGADALGPRANSTRPTAQPKPVGTLVRNPELAALLEQIAARGPEHFYTGAAAAGAGRGPCARAARNPSPMTAGDLATYQAQGARRRSAAPIAATGSAAWARPRRARPPCSRS